MSNIAAVQDANQFPALIGHSDTSDTASIVRLVADSSGNLGVVSANTLPTSGNNPSLVLAYTSDNLTTITKTIGSTAYAKTLTYDVDDNLETVSEWSAA